MYVCIYYVGDRIHEKLDTCRYFVDEFVRAIESGVSPANFNVRLLSRMRYFCMYVCMYVCMYIWMNVCMMYVCK